jgi:HK97 gp10 family phage protein
MKLDLRVRNAKAVVANLFSFDARVQAGVRKEVRATGKFTRELTQFLAPVRTGFMRDHVRDEYSDDGLAVQVGWFADDFTSAALPFYPPFQEFGTSRMPAQPSLGPAYAEAKPIFEANLRKMLQDAIRRMEGRR